MLVSFDENGFQAWEIPPDHAAIFSIESLEDRWHLVFARRDQVSTRSTLEFSYEEQQSTTILMECVGDRGLLIGEGNTLRLV